MLPFHRAAAMSFIPFDKWRGAETRPEDWDSRLKKYGRDVAV